MKRLCFFVFILLTALMFGCGGPHDNATAEPGDNDPVIEDVMGEVGKLLGLIDLGDLVAPAGDHWYFTRVRGINNQGTVIGQSNNGSPTKGAFKWDVATGGMTFLGIHNRNYNDYFGQFVTDAKETIQFIYSEAVALNNTNQIIGNSTTGTGWPDETEKRAFLWRNNQFIDLPPVPDLFALNEMQRTGAIKSVNFSEAKDINNAGEIVLTMEDGLPGDKHAYYWDGISTRIYSLPKDDDTTINITAPDYIMLGGIVGSASDAVAINENGQAIVNSDTTAVFHDLNWGVVETLNYLPGATRTVAVDINDSIYTNNDGVVDGHVIGNSGTFEATEVKALLNHSFAGAATPQTLATIDPIQGFFWDGGAMYPVNHLGGGKSIVADLNNKDQVVGAALTTAGATHAILWSLGANKKGIIKDLGTLGGTNSMALKINEAGQVVGWAETGDFYEEQGVRVAVRHAFFWDSGVMYDLGVHNDFYVYPFIPSHPFSEAVALNELGDVAGNSITINSIPRGFYLRPVIPAP